jgi:hypothetical protein
MSLRSSHSDSRHHFKIPSYKGLPWTYSSLFSLTVFLFCYTPHNNILLKHIFNLIIPCFHYNLEIKKQKYPIKSFWSTAGIKKLTKILCKKIYILQKIYQTPVASSILFYFVGICLSFRLTAFPISEAPMNPKLCKQKEHCSFFTLAHSLSCLLVPAPALGSKVQEQAWT